MKEGWDIKRVKDIIIEIKDGGTPSRTKPEYFGGPVNWCVVKDILPEIYSTKETLTELGLSKCSAKIWPINSVIISLGATIGQVGIAKIPVATKQGISGIVLDETLLKPEFLVYFLNYKKEFIQASASGTTIKEIRPTKLAEILEIPVPPLPEQQRILSIIDEAFEAIDKAIENTQKNLQNAKELFESYLNNVFENGGEGWEEKKVNEIGNAQTGTTPKTVEKENYGDFIPFIKPADVDFSGIGDIRYDNEGLSEIGLKKGRKMESGSTLMVCIGATIGKVGIAECEVSCNQQINSLTVKEGFEPKFIYYAMTTREFQNKVLLEGKGAQATLPIINKSKWENLTISFPKSKTQQQAIVRQLNSLRVETQQLERIYQQKLRDLEELKKSILNKAFAGEL
jgi:type I restriction enzyme S subunit